MTAQKGITDIAGLQPVEKNIYLWKGDITTLQCGAIVNAANSGMTGCYHPCHNCIDNCIHTFAGVRLRLKCAEIIKAQGHEEPTGTAKITPAYNLPCQYVIHTVGPIVQDGLTQKHCNLLKSCYQNCLELAVLKEPSAEDKRLLQSCYWSCLQLAEKNHCASIAFCCISTGVFGFPHDKAAEIAVQTVREFLKTHDIEVIFNVFTEKDFDIYKRLLF